MRPRKNSVFRHFLCSVLYPGKKHEARKGIKKVAYNFQGDDGLAGEDGPPGEPGEMGDVVRLFFLNDFSEEITLHDDTVF